MKQSHVIAVVIALLAVAGRPEARDPEGFGNIPFGMDREVVLKKLETEYSLRRKFPVPGSPLSSPEGMELREEDGMFVLDGYRKGGRSYTATFYFNLDDQFYGYMLEGMARGSSFTHALREEVLSLSRYYQQSYGEPGTRLKVSFRGVAERAETFFPVRDDSNFTVMTGVVHRRSGWGKNRVLVATVVVCDRRIRNRPAAGEAQALADEARGPRKVIQAIRDRGDR
ncbi:MAG: hypothetical protein GF418_05265 [Chitinivibrionales bacterium]|nr:hypothetical protein [Chitinivibrionales bacterium]MBD3395020.1 hypothetical protein [Chitinivibrionales bacterium]